MKTYYCRVNDLSKALEKSLLPFSISELIPTFIFIFILFACVPIGIWQTAELPEANHYDPDVDVLSAKRIIAIVCIVFWYFIAYCIFEYISQPSGYNPFRWLSHFYNANIKCAGYRWWGLDSKTKELIIRDLRSDEYPGETVFFWILVPWGGWFAKTSVLVKDDPNVICTQKCVLSYLDKLEVTKGGTVAKLSDTNDGAIQLPIETMLCFLAHDEWIFSHCRIGNAVRSIMVSRQDSLDPNVFIGITDEIFQQIRRTARFQKQIEGWDILSFLVSEMLDKLPDGHRLRQKYAELRMPSRPVSRHSNRKANTKNS